MPAKILLKVGCTSMRRRMYDSIVQESPLLPPGVNLATILESCGEAEVAEVVQMLPDEGRVSAAALVAAGMLAM